MASRKSPYRPQTRPQLEGFGSNRIRAVFSLGAERRADSSTVSDIRTYSLHDYTVPDPDRCHDVTLAKPLTVTVGTQALEPGIVGGRTLVRFALPGGNPLLERMPKMRLKVFTRATPSNDSALIFVQDPLFVELLFDNESFLTERMEMPFWLIDTLEFAAKTLRAQYELNGQGVQLEDVD